MLNFLKFKLKIFSSSLMFKEGRHLMLKTFFFKLQRKKWYRAGFPKLFFQFIPFK